MTDAYQQVELPGNGHSVVLTTVIARRPYRVCAVLSNVPGRFLRALELVTFNYMHLVVPVAFELLCEARLDFMVQQGCDVQLTLQNDSPEPVALLVGLGILYPDHPRGIAQSIEPLFVRGTQPGAY